ncbi:FHA domain-containing protein [Chloroflexota bacterium]
MKALLVLQEGPGAGQQYSLDPALQPVVSVGRSSGCQITLNDHRASRHHADFRWDGRQWTVVDQGSTNGTYVNGMRVHGPYELRLSDRVTIGETTMVLRESVAQPGPAAGARPQVGYRDRAAEEDLMSAVAGSGHRAEAQPSGTPPAALFAFWLVQVIVAVAIVCLASGAVLPWLTVSGKLSQDLAPMVQKLSEVISFFTQQDKFFEFNMEIGGLQGFGKLTIAMALISLVAMVIDIFVYRKSIVPGVVYLLASLISIGAMASDLMQFYELAQDLSSLSLMFGIQLSQIVQFFDQVVDMTVTPMAGLYLTVAGLGILLVAGIGRLIVGLIEWVGRR